MHWCLHANDIIQPRRRTGFKKKGRFFYGIWSRVFFEALLGQQGFLRMQHANKKLKHFH
jgi:hypothetical protein